MPNGWANARTLAEESGISLKTINNWSKMGLLRVQRQMGRLRLYDRKESLKRIERIRELRIQGYSLNKIKDILKSMHDK
jgi:DNA-binding transcriptional MerR regulator